jgi:hypothetical protein
VVFALVTPTVEAMAQRALPKTKSLEELGMNRATRDALIVHLRGQNWTLERIAARVGMTFGGVRSALQRIDEENDPEDGPDAYWRG